MGLQGGNSDGTDVSALAAGLPAQVITTASPVPATAVPELKPSTKVAQPRPVGRPVRITARTAAVRARYARTRSVKMISTAAASARATAHKSASVILPTSAEVDSAPSLQRMASALRHEDFRLFWAGNFLSNIGTWMQNVAQGWLVLQLTNSAFWLGVVGFAASFPILLFALIGGVIADHMNKRKLLMMTQSAMMVFAFTMAALAWFKVINVHEIVFLALGTGIAMSLNTPTYQALVPQLVPREDLTN